MINFAKLQLCFETIRLNCEGVNSGIILIPFEEIM